MSGMWKRSHGGTIEAPPNERGGNRYVLPNATAPHLDSTNRVVLAVGRPLPVYPDQRTSSDRSSWSGWCQQQTHAPRQISFDDPSTKVLPKEYATSPRRIARYLAKNAPTQPLIEPRSLETNRVNNSSPAATTTCLLLRHCHHAGPNPGATECLGQIHEVDGQKSKRSPTTDPADDLAIFRSSNDDMQRHAITIAHDRIIKSVKTVTDAS
jgi:hypothetical protein